MFAACRLWQLKSAVGQSRLHLAGFTSPKAPLLLPIRQSFWSSPQKKIQTERKRLKFTLVAVVGHTKLSVGGKSLHSTNYVVHYATNRKTIRAG